MWQALLFFTRMDILTRRMNLLSGKRNFVSLLLPPGFPLLWLFAKEQMGFDPYSPYKDHK